MNIANLFQNIPHDFSDEFVESLVTSTGCRIERIVSRGHHSAADFWYDQPENEWVLIVKGAATLRLEENDEIIQLTAGMHVIIPAHQKHRVEWTKEDEETIWLAVFY